MVDLELENKPAIGSLYGLNNQGIGRFIGMERKNKTLSKSRALLDLALILSTGIAVFYFFTITDLAEHLNNFLPANEQWELDEILLAVLLSVFGWAFFAFRRWKEHQAELIRHQKTQVQLNNSSSDYRGLFEQALDAIVVFRPDDEMILDANQRACDLYGFPRDQFIGMSLKPLSKNVARGESQIAETLAKGTYFRSATTQYRKDGSEMDLEINASLVDFGGEKAILSINRDVTERNKAQLDRERIFQMTNYLICVAGMDGFFKEVNHTWETMLGFSEQELMSKRIVHFIHPEDRRETVAAVEGKLFHGKELLNYENRYRCKDGTYKWIHWSIHPVVEEQLLYCIGFDVSARKQAEALAQRQLRRLSSLHTIDRAITESLDLEITLNVLLKEITTQLKVDAVSVLLLDSQTDSLNYSAGCGFHSDFISKTHLRMGEGYAGKAALEMKPCHIANLHIENQIGVATLVQRESFVAYYNSPLIARDRVIGVLEVFHRSPLKVDQDWLDFFALLGEQAAIAIDNASLVGRLQRTNWDLSNAYDTTLKGWVKALDLKDHETVGHTERVAEITVLLASQLRVSTEELVHIHRGALLHDIGKMAIPDSILLKPCKLTNQEWDVMKQHPVYAYEWLKDIKFLQPALDIPYCHHEKWDGTGYPRGISGTDIPLAARIFAVVDVWDALSSDRPYRKAWPQDKVTEHICAQSGKHFDPDVVQAFLNWIGLHRAN